MTAPVTSLGAPTSVSASATGTSPLPLGEGQGEGRPLLTEHFTTIASAPNGIKKLRELILELAVRGRLVPQDSADEPAYELLKRVAKNREQLAADGKHKRAAVVTPIDAEEVSFEVPQGWGLARFPEVASYRVGKTPPTKDARFWTGGEIPWVSISDLNHNGRVDSTVRRVTKAAAEEVFKCLPARAGSILMSFKLTLGKISKLSMDAYHNEAIISIVPFEGIDMEYLFTVLPEVARKGRSKNALMGDTLNSESLAALVIPIPPQMEQGRIVRKVDELMVLCDQLEAQQADAEAAHEKLVRELLATLTQSQSAADFQSNWQRLATHFDTLFTTESSIESLQGAITELAVMGKLVYQNSDDEPAKDFVSRIRAKKNQMLSNGEGRKQKELVLDTLQSPPFAIPLGWEWEILDNLLLISGGVTLGRKLAGPALISRPYLRVANVQRGHLDLDQIKEIEVPANEVEKYALRNGDLLITEGGDWDKVGRTAIWREEIPDCLHQNHVFRARPVSEDWCSRWAELYLNSASARDYFAGSSKQTTNLASINMTQLRSCAFPVPPIAEQRRIVTKLDELVSICEQLRLRIKQEHQLKEKLSDVLIENVLN